MTEPRTVRSVTEFLETVRARALELGATRPQIDEVAGLTPGYAGKLLGLGQVRRAVSESLFPLLWSLGLRIEVTEDPDALEAVKSHYGRKRGFPSNQYEANR